MASSSAHTQPNSLHDPMNAHLNTTASSAHIQPDNLSDPHDSMNDHINTVASSSAHTKPDNFSNAHDSTNDRLNAIASFSAHTQPNSLHDPTNGHLHTIASSVHTKSSNFFSAHDSTMAASFVNTQPNKFSKAHDSMNSHLNTIASSAHTKPNNFPNVQDSTNGHLNTIVSFSAHTQSNSFSNAHGSLNGHLNTIASSSADIHPNNLRARTGIQRAATVFTPDKPLAPPPSVLQSLKAILLVSWLNILLLCMPVSWALHFALPESNEDKDTLVFVSSFLSIIPLANLFAFATKEISMRVMHRILAEFMNVTLGNAVGLILTINALVNCELGIVQSSLLGSIFSNLLLVLGMCFFAGGLKHSQQGFGVSATQLNSSLLTISVIALLLPAAFHFIADAALTDVQEANDILAVSHGVSLVLLIIYAGYIWFQLYSHAPLYQNEGIDITKSTVYSSRPRPFHFRPSKSKDMGACDTPEGNKEQSGVTPQDKLKTPHMTLWTTICLLVVVTVLSAFTAKWLVTSIRGLTSRGHISKEFVGVILLPIITIAGNAPDRITAVKIAVKDKLTLSLGVVVGPSIQIALFVVPFIVTLGWILGKPLTLLFDPYESVALFLSVLTVNYVVQDGRSNWLEGFILMGLYLILAVTFWYYPGSGDLTC